MPIQLKHLAVFLMQAHQGIDLAYLMQSILNRCLGCQRIVVQHLDRDGGAESQA